MGSGADPRELVQAAGFTGCHHDRNPAVFIMEKLSGWGDGFMPLCAACSHTERKIHTVGVRHDGRWAIDRNVIELARKWDPAVGAQLDADPRIVPADLAWLEQQRRLIAPPPPDTTKGGPEGPPRLPPRQSSRL